MWSKTAMTDSRTLGQSVPKEGGFGELPNKHFRGKKRRLRFLLRFLRFFRCFHCLDCSFNDFQFSFVQGVQHGIHPLSALAPAILGWVKVLIHRYIKHCDHLIKGVEAWMLTVIFVIHNGTRSAVNNIFQLLLRHAAGFSCPLDGAPYIVKIKASRSIFITSPNMILHFMWYYLNDCLFHATAYLISLSFLLKLVLFEAKNYTVLYGDAEWIIWHEKRLPRNGAWHLVE